jgi:hypothetical protein
MEEETRRIGPERIVNMSENTQQILGLGLVLVLIIGILGGVGVSCHAVSLKSFETCIKAGYSPLECNSYSAR